MKLYDVSEFPSPRRVRMFLAEKGIDDVEFEQVDVVGGDARREPFVSKNPLGQVPVLEFDDGTTLSEATAISRYFEEVRPDPPLMGTTARERAAVEMWQRRVDGGLAGAVANYFHHATPGFGPLEEYQITEWGDKNRERALATMRFLDKELASRPFIAGEAFSIADITAFCGMDFAKACGIEPPADAAHLRAWYDRVSSRDSAAA